MYVWACGSYLAMKMVYGRRCSNGIGMVKCTAESGLSGEMGASFLFEGKGSEQMGLRQSV